MQLNAQERWYQKVLPDNNSALICFGAGATSSFLTNVVTDDWGEPLLWSSATTFGSAAMLKHYLEQNEGIYYRQNSDKLRAMMVGICVGTSAGKTVRYSIKSLKYLSFHLYKSLFSSKDKESEKDLPK